MSRICICFNCDSSDKITCVPEDVKDINEVFPEWLRTNSYYESPAVHQESFGPPSKISCFKHYISFIVHKDDRDRNQIPYSDVLLGRMANKILMIDLIVGKEIELTLSESAQATMDDSLMTREELCNLWPDFFFLINREWAILSLKKHFHFNHNSWCALLLVQIDSKTGSLTPKDSLLYWNHPLNGCFVSAWQNVNVNSIDDPLCGFSVKNCIPGDPRFGQNMMTLFVSADLRSQKLKVLKAIPGHIIDWSNLYISALVSRKLCMFGVELGELMGRPNATFLNFHQMNIYNLDDEKKGLQLKEMTLPKGYEHEFVRRSPVSPELLHTAWSSEHVTLCLAAKPPFHSVSNTFLLNLPTSTWHKIQIPDNGAVFSPLLQNRCRAFYRFGWFSDQTLITKSSHVLFDKDANRSIMERWNRTHIRRPSSLLELAWIRAIRLHQIKGNMERLHSLLQL